MNRKEDVLAIFQRHRSRSGHGEEVAVDTVDLKPETEALI